MPIVRMLHICAMFIENLFSYASIIAKLQKLQFMKHSCLSLVHRPFFSLTVFQCLCCWKVKNELQLLQIKN